MAGPASCVPLAALGRMANPRCRPRHGRLPARVGTDLAGAWNPARDGAHTIQALSAACAGQWANLFFVAHGSAREVAAAFDETSAGGLILLGECLLPQASLQLPLLHEWTRWATASPCTPAPVWASAPLTHHLLHVHPGAAAAAGHLEGQPLAVPQLRPAASSAFAARK